MNIGFLCRRLFVIFCYLPTALFSNVSRSYKRIKNDQTRNAIVTAYKSLVDHFSDSPFTEAFCVKLWIQMEIQEVLRGVKDKEMQKITYKCIYPVYIPWVIAMPRFLSWCSIHLASSKVTQNSHWFDLVYLHFCSGWILFQNVPWQLT